MSDIEFSKDEIDRLTAKIKTYFESELDQEIGAFQAEFLLDFFTKEVGPYFYNHGLADAKALFAQQAEEINYLVHELEKPTP